MHAEPEHRAILALDIEGFGRLERTNLDRARMRTGLHRIIGNALSAAGIDPDHIEQTEYGDGVLVLLGPQVSKARLLYPLLPRLVSGLARYNRTAANAARLRVRAVVHAGELLRDAHGITGEDLVLAFRLLGADVVRAHLTQTVADLVLIVSDAMYQGIVKHGYGRIDPAVFQSVWVTAKETSTRAWLHIPSTGRQDMLASPAAATSPSLTTPYRSGSLAPPAPPPTQPTPPIRPVAGRGLSGTWQLPAYAYIQGCEANGSWMHVGDAMTTSIGYRVEEGRAPNFWKTLLYPADRDRIIAADEWSEQTLEPFQMTYRYIARDGRCVWVRDECVAMYDDTGTPRYWLGATLVLTDRAIMELDATRRLKVLNALSATFLAVASRKLRAPLTSIMGTCRTLQQAGNRLPEHTRRELLSGVATTVRRLDRLLTDVIDLQRLDWGAVTLDRQPIDIATLVQRVAARWRAQGRRPEVLAPSATVRLDASKVERIIHELLANAITHTPPGTPVWVRTARHGTGVLITVEDAGPGIPREFRTAVFERFSHDRTTLVHPPGVAVGLSLVLCLAELHGGTAWVRDRPGGGTSVSVILPGPPTPASFADLEPAVLYARDPANAEMEPQPQRVPHGPTKSVAVSVLQPSPDEISGASSTRNPRGS
jgi:signal transduction histidine kinase